MQFSTELIEKVESDYLRLLVRLIQSGDLETADARLLTEEFLAMTPFSSLDDLQNKIQKFTSEHPEFGGVYMNLLKYEDEKKTADLIEQMRSHIKENRLDEALNLVNNK